MHVTRDLVTFIPLEKIFGTSCVCVSIILNKSTHSTHTQTTRTPPRPHSPTHLISLVVRGQGQVEWLATVVKGGHDIDDVGGHVIPRIPLHLLHREDAVGRKEELGLALDVGVCDEVHLGCHGG